MLLRCALAALLLLCPIPALSQEDGQSCATIGDIVERAVVEEPDTIIADQFTGARARALVQTIADVIEDGEPALVADQVLVFAAPGLPLKVLIGFHHNCALFRLALPEPVYRALLQATFGDPA